MASNSPSPMLFCAHLFALSGFAIAQPMYDWISHQPEFLVAHGVLLSDALVLVFFLSVMVPLMLLGVLLVTRIFGRRAFRVAQVSGVGVLGGVMALQLLPQERVCLAFLLAGVFAVAAAALYCRSQLVRSFLSLSAVAAFVFPLVFLLSDPVRGMVLAGEGATSEQERVTVDEESAETDVIILMLDELPLTTLLDDRGRIDRERFPNFGRLADHSTWYRNAVTVHRGTQQAVPAALTGRVPDPERRRAEWRLHPDNLLTWAASMYSDAVQTHEEYTNLCPAAICADGGDVVMTTLLLDVAVLYAWHVLPDALARRHLPPIDAKWNRFVDVVQLMRLYGGSEVGALRVAGLRLLLDVGVERSRAWRQALSAMYGGFRYVHLFLPHIPYEYLPDGLRYPDPLRSRGYTHLRAVPAHNVLALQRHVAQTQYTDRLLGELIDRLQRSGRWDDTLLVVVSDHGTSFRNPSDLRTLHHDSLADVLAVPLFVKRPGQSEGRIDDYPASIIDIAPTIADGIGGELDWPVDGFSLMREDRPNRGAVPVSCAGAFACTGELMERTDADSLFLLDTGELRDAATTSLAWMHDRIVYSRALDFVVPTSPATSMMGRPLTELELAQESGGRVELLDPEALADVDPDRDELPALVAGRLRGADVEAGDWLVVALNGTIAGAARAASPEDAQYSVFAALLPPQIFVAGANEVDVYRLSWPDDDDPVLLPLEHG